MELLNVAVIGRPNVGKSTLFNRLIGRRKSIEADLPGTTRDRVYDNVEWVGKSFRLIDTAGLFDLKPSGISDKLSDLVRDNVYEALDEANLILFVVDYAEPDTELDKLIASMLRRSKKDVILVVNKCDNLERIKNIDAFKRLGNWPTIGVSANLKKNLGELLDLIIEKLKEKTNIADIKENENTKTIAIAGRPNVGKSTLFNTLINKKQAITSSVAGTTRDTAEFYTTYKEQSFKIIDTAGLVRPGKTGKGVERFSIIRTLRAVDDADVVIVLMDSLDGVTALDKKIAGLAADAGKSLILVFNKIDLVEDSGILKNDLTSICRHEFNYLPFVPLIFISAINKENTKVIFRQVTKILEERSKIIDQSDLDEFKDLLGKGFGQLPEISSFIQSGSNPPKFTIKLRNKKKRWHFTFTRFVENRLRDNFSFIGTPIIIEIK